MPESHTLEAIDEALLTELLDESRDVARNFSVLIENLRSGSAAMQETLHRMLRDLENVRQRARSVHRPLLETLVHRMAHYLDGLEDLTASQISDQEIFLDIMNGILDEEISEDTDIAEFVRSLPSKKVADIEELIQNDIEILLITPKSMSARLVERELQACGYRVTTAYKAMDGLQLAIRTKPDLVVASQVLDEMSGVDIASALLSMPVTRDAIPVAVLTSFEQEHHQLADLPENAALVRKGKGFGDDVAKALQKFRIT